jgi:anti-sigma factor RsiW
LEEVMTCPTEQDLHRYHDGELAGGDRGRLALHLADCGACQARLAEFRQIGALLRNAPLPQPAVEAMQRWQRNLAAMQDRQVRRFAGWMTAAASVVLAASLYVATSNQAQAVAPAVAEWEAAVVGIGLESPAPEQGTSTYQTTAQWIVTDLSRASSGASPEGGQPR